MKLNCWEFMKCGREPGGSSVEKLGVCPVTTDDSLDGVHGGRNAGRACWVMAGTFGNGSAACKFAPGKDTCLECAFFNKVKEEEGENLQRAMRLLEILEHHQSKKKAP